MKFINILGLLALLVVVISDLNASDKQPRTSGKYSPYSSPQKENKNVLNGKGHRRAAQDVYLGYDQSEEARQIARAAKIAQAVAAKKSKHSPKAPSGEHQQYSSTPSKARKARKSSELRTHQQPYPVRPTHRRVGKLNQPQGENGYMGYMQAHQLAQEKEKEKNEVRKTESGGKSSPIKWNQDTPTDLTERKRQDNDEETFNV